MKISKYGLKKKKGRLRKITFSLACPFLLYFYLYSILPNSTFIPESSFCTSAKRKEQYSRFCWFKKVTKRCQALFGNFLFSPLYPPGRSYHIILPRCRLFQRLINPDEMLFFFSNAKIFSLFRTLCIISSFCSSEYFLSLIPICSSFLLSYYI